MRVLVIVGLFVAVAMAGCVENDSSLEGNSGNSGDPDLVKMPTKRFEPELIIKAESPTVAKGDLAKFTFEISDLDDYSFPMTFIDWEIKYNREAVPILEGDATVLPGEYERVLFAVDYHVFCFKVDDGQGFKDTAELVIKVGEPDKEPDTCFPKVSDTGEIIETTTNSGAVYEPMVIDASIYTVGGCSDACLGTLSGRTLAGTECPGLHRNDNGVGCAWVEIPPSAVGSSFTISSGPESVQSDPDGIALEACKPFAPRIASYGEFGGEAGEILPGTGCLVAWHYQDRDEDIIFHVDEFQNAVSGNIPYDTEPLLTYTTPPANGCTEDVISAAGTNSCAGLMAGPYNSILDGHWIALDERHEGAALVTGINAPEDPAADGIDTDCLFLDHMLNRVGSAHNGLGHCTGIVPAEAHWLFLYPYGNGKQFPGMTVELTLDAAKAEAAEALGRPVGSTLMADYIDAGTYWMHKDTSVCYVKDFTSHVPGQSYQAFGLWFFQETNGIPGLQVNDETGTTEGAGIGSAVSGSGCTHGDATVL